MKLKKYLLNESIFNMTGIVGNKKITKPVVAKDEEDAIKQYKKFLNDQIKHGHIAKGKIKKIIAKKM